MSYDTGKGSGGHLWRKWMIEEEEELIVISCYFPTAHFSVNSVNLLYKLLYKGQLDRRNTAGSGQ